MQGRANDLLLARFIENRHRFIYPHQRVQDDKDVEDGQEQSPVLALLDYEGCYVIRCHDQLAE